MRIEVVLFDLGNVILPFSHYPIAQKLSPFSDKEEFRDPQKIFAYLFDPQEGAINLFDVGGISPEAFFQSLKEDLDLSLSYEDFIPIWNEIFTEDPEVSEVIRSLKGKRKLGLFSNTDPLHFSYILSRFPIIRAFEKWILSYEVGFRKPDLRMYQEAIEWASAPPEKILLIDDIKKHIEAALTLGMAGIHFISARQLKDELEEKLQTGQFGGD